MTKTQKRQKYDGLSLIAEFVFFPSIICKLYESMLGRRDPVLIHFDKIRSTAKTDKMYKPVYCTTLPKLP